MKNEGKFRIQERGKSGSFGRERTDLKTKRKP